MSCVRYPIGPRIGHQSQIEKGLIFRGLGLCRDTVQKKIKKKLKNYVLGELTIWSPETSCCLRHASGSK